MDTTIFFDTIKWLYKGHSIFFFSIWTDIHLEYAAFTGETLISENSESAVKNINLY